MAPKGPHPPFGHLLHAKGRGEGTTYGPPEKAEFSAGFQFGPFSSPLAGEGGRRPDEVPLAAIYNSPAHKEGKER